jgi:hypothetical protein
MAPSATFLARELVDRNQGGIATIAVLTSYYGTSVNGSLVTFDGVPANLGMVIN